MDSIAVDAQGNVFIGGRNAKDGAFVRIIHAETGKIETLAREVSPAGPALGVRSSDANLSDPKGIVITSEGKVLISADESHVIVEQGRTTRLVAGTEGQKGFSGDGGPADRAQFDLPGALARDGKGNVFVADYFNDRIRRIDGQTGIVTTVAGNGNGVSSGELPLTPVYLIHTHSPSILRATYSSSRTARSRYEGLMQGAASSGQSQEPGTMGSPGTAVRQQTRT